MFGLLDLCISRLIEATLEWMMGMNIAGSVLTCLLRVPNVNIDSMIELHDIVGSKDVSLRVILVTSSYDLGMSWEDMSLTYVRKYPLNDLASAANIISR